MKKQCTRILSILLVISVIVGFLPAEQMHSAFAEAAEQLNRAQSAATLATDFSWVLEQAAPLAEGGERAEGEWRYVVLPDRNWAVVTGHADPSATRLSVPRHLGGADVVALLDGALADHRELMSLSLPGNVNAVGQRAIPRGVTLEGYNGSYAQWYASRGGYPFRSLSEFDFQPGVVDFADVETSAFQRKSQHAVRLRSLEASRLREGTIFFLVDPSNPYQVSYYRVKSIAPDGDGFVLLTCETPKVAQLVKTLYMQDVPMHIATDSVVLYDGATWSGAGARGGDSEKMEKEFSIALNRKINDSASVRIQGKLKVTGTATVQYDGRDEIQIHTYRSEAYIGGELKYQNDQFVPPAFQNDKEAYRQKLLETMRQHAELYKGTAWKQSVLSADKEIGRCVLASFGGMVNVSVVLGVRVDFAAAVELGYQYTTETTVRVENGDITAKCDKTTSHDGYFKAEGALKVGICLELAISLVRWDIVSASLFAGLSFEAKYEPNTSAPVDMLDTVEIEVSIEVDLGFRIALGKRRKASLEKNERDFWHIVGDGEIKLISKSLLTAHAHLVPIDSTGKAKDNWHFAQNCPYNGYCVTFTLPALGEESKYYHYQMIDGLGVDDTVDRPTDPDIYGLTGEKRKFMEWYTDPSMQPAYAAKTWPYIVNPNSPNADKGGNITFYGDVVDAYDATFQYADGTSLGKKLLFGVNEAVEFPESKDDRNIVGWYVTSAENPEDTSNYLPGAQPSFPMPEGDTLFVARCTNDVIVHFITNIAGNPAVDVDYAHGEQIQPPEIAMQRPRFAFKGWMGSDGKSMTLPMQANAKAGRRLSIIAQWEFIPKVTAQPLGRNELSGTPVGYGGETTSYSQQRYFTFGGLDAELGTCTVTGFKSTQYRTVIGADGKSRQESYQVSPGVLYIPSTYTVEYSDGTSRSYRVTGVSSNAFAKWETLTTVVLPSTIRTIGSGAFMENPNLQTIDVSSTKISALPWNFARDCPRLTRVLLPEKLNSIGNSAFYGCTALTTGLLDASLGDSAFYGCTALRDVTLGGGVKSIGGHAFQNCASLEELELPDSVTSYGGYMLNGCTSLKRLVIGGGVEKLAYRANPFYIGEVSALEYLEIQEGVKIIEEYVFANGGYSLKSHYHPNLETIVLPESLEVIGNYAFQNANIQSLKVKGNLKRCGYGAFSGCKQLETVEIEGWIENDAFINCTALRSATITGKGTSIGAYVFKDCTALKEVNLLGEITSIGQYAFQNCASLEELTIPHSVTSYGSLMLIGCKGLKRLVIGGGVETLPYYYNPFYIGKESALEYLEIQEGVKGIGANVFANGSNVSQSSYAKCYHPNLKTVILPESLNTIGDNAFQNAGIQSLTMKGGIDIETWGSGVFNGCKQLETMEIVGTVGKGAFENCTALRSVTITGRGTGIGEFAFYGCTALKEVNLQGEITSIGGSAFRNCASLEELTIPHSVTSYGGYMLNGCTSLKRLVIGGGVEKLNNAFYIGEESVLEYLEIQEGVKEIDEYVFANRVSHAHYHPNLKTVVLPESLEVIGNYAFRNAGIQSLKVKGNLKRCGNGAFFDCKQLETVEISGAIGYSAFENCTALRSVTITGQNTGISYNVFKNCTALKEMRLLGEITSIGQHAFCDCVSLEELIIPHSVTSYGSHMLLGCTGLKRLVIGGGVETLPYYYNPFYIGKGSTLEYLEIQEGVKKIISGVFANGSSEGYSNRYHPNLKTVILPESLVEIGSNIFEGASLTTLRIGSAVTSLSMAQGSMPDLTVYSDSYNELVAQLAAKLNVPYKLGEAEAFPVHLYVVTDECELYDSQTCHRFQLLTLPKPQVGGWVFDGWFTDADCTTPWRLDLAQAPVESLTLYGHMSPLPSYPANFVLVYPDGMQTPYYTADVMEGNTVPLPNEPVIEGFVLEDWYVSELFVTPWSPKTMHEPGMTVYGKLTRITAGGVYEPCDGGLMLVEYALEQDESPKVALPSQIGGVPVVAIGDYAFQNQEITSLTLPAGLERVAEHAFDGMPSLKTLRIRKGNAHFVVRNNTFYSADGTVLLRYPQGRAIQHFEMPQEVQTIAPGAFRDAEELRTIQFSEALTEIGAEAFDGCLSLEAVQLPDSVTTLGARAFNRCWSLERFTAYGLESIGENALPQNGILQVFGPEVCGALRDACVTPDGTVFIRYNRYKLTLNVDGQVYGERTAESGMPIGGKNMAVYLEGLGSNGDASAFVLPDGRVIFQWYADSAAETPWDLDVDRMPAKAFTLYASTTPLFVAEEAEFVTGTALDENGEEVPVTIHGMRLTGYNGKGGHVVLPETLNGQPVLGIGAHMLVGAKGEVLSVRLGKSLREIARDAFSAADDTPFGGTLITVPGTYAAQWVAQSGLKGENRQFTLSFVTGSVALPPITAAAGAGVKLPLPVRDGAVFEGWYLDADCKTPAEVDEYRVMDMPAQDVTLYAAWDGEGELIPFTWQEVYAGGQTTLTITGYTGGMSSITVPETIHGCTVTAIGRRAFANINTRRISLPATVKVIGEGAFEGAVVSSVDVGGAVTIGDNAFADCAALLRVTMANAQTLGEAAFRDCASLAEIALPDTLQRIGAYAFEGCIRLESLTLPDSVTQLGEYAFKDCDGLRTVTLGAGLHTLPASAFRAAKKLQRIAVSPQNTAFTSVDGVLYDASGYQLVCYPAGRQEFAFVLPDGVGAVAASAFEGAAHLQFVTLPASLTVLGEGAFRSCSALTRFALDGEQWLAEIPDNAFQNCRALREVVLNAYVERIGSGAFLNCPALQRVVIPAETREIHDLAFGSHPMLVIEGVTGSAAHAYAQQKGLGFTDPNALEPTALTLQAEATELERGETMQLTLLVEPADALANADIEWFSDNESVLRVTDGLVRAMGGGHAAVVAKARNGLTASMTLHVRVSVTAVELSASALRIPRGSQLQVDAHILPETATDKKLTWSSSQPEVATVDEGVVTAIGQGTALLTATAHNGVVGQLEIQVYNPVEEIRLAEPEGVGSHAENPVMLCAVSGINERLVQPVVLPADATDSTLLWTSSDPKVATVDEQGRITALKPGTASITATAQDGSQVVGTLYLLVKVFDLGNEAIHAPAVLELTYNGRAQTLEIPLTCNETSLVQGVDFVVEPNALTDAGAYDVVLRGQGVYSGEITVQAVAHPASVQIQFPMTPWEEVSGKRILRLSQPVPAFTVEPEECPVEVRFAHYDAEGALTELEEMPTEPGAYRVTVYTVSSNYVPLEKSVDVTLVESWLEGVTLSAQHPVLQVGQSARLDIVQLGQASEAAFHVENTAPEVASVDADGQIRALSAGVAEITFMALDGSGVTVQCTVRVVDELSTLQLPAMLGEVYEEAFMGNESVQRVALPDGLRAIGARAFADMAALKQVELGNSLQEIAEDAFAGNDGMLFLCPWESVARQYAIEHGIPYLVK